MASDRRAYLSSLLIMPIAASLLLSACLRRMPPTAPAQPLAPPAAEAETETGRPGPHRETRKRYWARINAYKQTAARARALGARLGMKESASSQTSPQTGPNPFAWTFLGPQPIQAPPPTSPLSGSIRDIILDPINSSVIYVLTYLGKIWKTTDSGQSWTPLLDFGPVTVVDTLVADPILPNTLYAENGALYQSSDGGQTWNALPPVVQDSAQDCQTLAFAVSPAGMVWLALELCPSNSDLNGVYRSADRGETWNLVLVPGLSSSTPSVAAYLLAVGDAPYQFVDLRFNPANANYAYVASTTDTGESVYISTDQGSTWRDVSPATQVNAQEIRLAPAPSSPNTLYLLVVTEPFATGPDNGFSNVLFTTTDGGTTWQQNANLPDLGGSPRDPSLLAVHPLDPTLVFLGSVYLFRSQDSGNTWQNVMTVPSGGLLHADQHALVFASDAKRLYESSDGGIWTATQPYAANIDWVSLNNGLGTAEIYSPIAVDAQDMYHALAGTQDNGTLLLCCSAGAAWSQTGVCGDGYGAAISPTNSAIAYAACHGSLFVSSGGGQQGSWSQLLSGLPGFQGTPHIALDPSNPRVIYLGSDGTVELYQSLDGGNTWRLLGSLPSPDGHLIQVSPSDPNVVYVTGSYVTGSYCSANCSTQQYYFDDWQGQLSVTTNAMATAPTWVSYTIPGASLPVGLAVGPSNASAVAVLSAAGYTGPYLFSKSSDGGATWQTVPIGSQEGSPGMTTSIGSDSQLAVDPDIANTFYITRDLSVYRSSDGGNTWYPLATGLPLVPGSGVSLHRASRTLWAATLGRGIWSLSVPLSAPRLSSVALEPNAIATSAALTVMGQNFDSNSVVQVNGQAVPTTFISANELDASIPTTTFPTAGIYYISVYKPGGAGGDSDPQPLAVGTLVFDGGLASAANPASTQLVPGAIMSLYGASLASAPASAATVPLPTMLGSTRVLVNNSPSPLLYVSPGQINFIVPWEVTGQTQATVLVQNGSVQSTPVQAQVAAASPAVFTLNQQGTGQGAVLIANTPIIAAPNGAFPGSAPVKKGEYIEIYATGLGAVGQTPPDGSGASGLDWVTQSYQVNFGCLGTNGATLWCQKSGPTYVGLAPGFPGLYQIDVQVPDVAESGDAVPLQLLLGGSYASNTFTIAIQ